VQPYAVRGHRRERPERLIENCQAEQPQLDLVRRRLVEEDGADGAAEDAADVRPDEIRDVDVDRAARRGRA
jgi:hypothetical protein